MDLAENIEAAAARVLSGGELTEPQALELASAGSPDEILHLASAASRVRRKFRGKRAELCALISARSGACSEDCAFCAQSGRAAAGVPVYELMPVEAIVARAGELAATGADHICLVMSGRGPSGPDLDVICRAAERISRDMPMAVCASLGLLDDSAAARLRAAGIARYNHNLETVESFFPRICRTHTWRQRRDTVLAARRAGMQICCGGILGLGESLSERVGLAFALKELNPELVPINLLNPRPGTALAGRQVLSPLEAIKAIALFRLILPRSTIKAAGGREAVLRGLQATAMLAGADGIIVAGYLTTPGRELIQDLEMIADCGFELSPAQLGRLASS